VVGWGAVLNLGWGEDGKRHRRWFRGKTQKEVLDALDEAKHQAKKGTLAPPGKPTVAKWMETWLRDVAKPEVRPSTYRMYEGFARDHIVPVLGRRLLEELTVADVRGLLNSRKGLSPRTVHHLRAVLRTALNVAVKDGLIASQRNVAAYAEPPKVLRTEMKAFTTEQAQAFLAAVQGDELEAIYVLALTVGMRQGEILGLRWRNVDLAGGTLSVDKALQRVGKEYRLVEPKSSTSVRLVQLPAMTAEALKAHREKQADSAQRPGTVRNLEWHDLVFRTATGRPLNGSWVHHRFQAATKAAGLPKLRFHDLRHSCVSLLGEAQVDVAVVSKMVGHSSVTLTLNTYRHVFEKAKREAANAMDAVMSESARKFTSAAAR
jgi:integrase